MMAKLIRLSCVALGISIGASATSSRPSVTNDSFDWESITPSWDLQYHDCYEGFQCSRLTLPLDWHNDTNGGIISIAIIRTPAVVDEGDPTFGGAIFAQPGGPAVSGTQYGRGIGPTLRDAFDVPGKKHYEILSFDTRGTGHSIPRIDCFPGVLNHVWQVESLARGALDLSPASLAVAVAAAKADGARCEEVHGDFLNYVGTPNTARDLVAMVDKVSERRRLLNAQQRQHGGEGVVELELRSTEQYEPDNGDDDVPRLQYIGISYGTFLGNTFASMYPDRVGRMVLDGVISTDDINHGAGWLTNTVDTDHIADLFFQGCFKAGPSVCALARSRDVSGSDISKRFWAWAGSLDELPLTAPIGNGGRVFLRSGEIRSLFLWSAYNAVRDSRPAAADFDSAMGGNKTALLARVQDFFMVGPLRDSCDAYDAERVIPVDARSAIVCADGEDVTAYTNDDWRSYLRRQLSSSFVAGEMWTGIRLLCAGWRARPNWIFRGPYTTPDPSASPEKPDRGRPAAPLLFTSNRLDPVTPLRNARAMAERHPGAGVVVQETIGHCAILGPMSPCLKSVLSRYFDTGEVSSEEISCEVDSDPWRTQASVDEDAHSMRLF